ncbi:P protein-like [Macrosteles quadrilineatus]|uniref:P protein-like n=1 Tax=Macrosteles quadrilineatus TaxID=74068 RepID=UPI0023E24CAF|nr:P protein-like [Macrosteles quadrilineatus]
MRSPKSGDMQGAYEVWNTLPEVVKKDPSFEPFRRYGHRLDQEVHISPSGSTGAKRKKALTFDVDVGGLSPKVQSSGGSSVPTVMIINPSDESLHLSLDEDEIANCPAGPSSKVEEEKESFDKEMMSFSDSNSSWWVQSLKISFLLSIWIMSCVVLMLVKTYSDINNSHQISVPPNLTRSYWILQSPTMRQIKVDLEGAILPTYYGNLTTKFMRVWVDLIQTRIPRSNITQHNIFYRKTISNVWMVPIVSEDVIDFAPEVRQSKLFDINDIEFEMIPNSLMCLQFTTNLAASFSISISYDLSPINTDDGIVYAAFILLGLYFLIITEIVHRTVAAMLAATVSVAVLALFGERPSHQDIVSWVDLETLTLLFSMMVFVAIFSETGVFDYLAVVAYRLSCYLTTKYKFFKLMGGRIWMLINILCINTVLVSSFLDNVTTILLMTPVTIRLCEVMELNPTPVLMAMIIFSNIGGAITPIGDPPNVIIANNKDIVSAGITFGVFTTRMGIPLTIIMILVHFQLRYMFRNIKDLQYTDPKDVQELRHEIVIWQRAAASLSSYSKEEDYVRETLMKKVQRLLSELKKKLLTGSIAMETYREDIEELAQKFPIRDKPLLLKSTLALMFVIVTFALQSMLELHLSMGSIAFLGALLLLLLDREDIVDVLARVEWSTLLFFTSLFILMEGLSRLGLIDFIGHQTEQVVKSVHPEYRLAASIWLILWVSAFTSSFLDNIPLTTMMVRIVVSLSQNEELGLPLQPLVWSLAIGSCLGGNGTLIGASSNLVCACVAERHGYKFTFMEFSRIGFPVMLWSLVIATAYLMLAHVWLGFNG